MKYRNDLKKRVLAGLFAGAALCLAAPAALAANSPIPNNTLPSGGSFVAGGNNGNIVTNQAANRVDITQTDVNAVIKWDSFNVGANATVTFEKADGGKFNTLNYVTDKGGMSQIYGNINAENGNIYIVNPAGVEIGNSAQINVGSLYVSNKNLDNFIKENMTVPKDMAAFIQQGTTTDAVLMSLGNINATNVTFDGNRIVIDTERLKDASGDNKLDAGNIIVRTNDASNVVIGYDAYDEMNKTYVGANSDSEKIATVNNTQITKKDGYMWVEDVEQLQAINTNLSGNYALRNSIDATATQDWNDAGTDTSVKEGFQSIGTIDKAFTGKFDGLDYNIFNLNINRADETNVGLFGVVGEGAVINNVTLVGGSIIGQNNVGALAGSVQGVAQISNITNSASVTGKYNVGGIVGESKGAAFTGLVNTGAIEAENSTDASNAGGLIGSMNGGTLGGASYNLGSVTGSGSNVGGLVGYAANAIIGNEGENAVTVYNRLNVTGAYNVGGIVGNMESTQVYNAENSGNVSATRYKTGDYFYHSAHYKESNEKDIVKQENVNIANAGGIAGSASGSSMITDVLNTGDVSSSTAEGNSYTYYMAGNVGGIVGSAVDTNITNATNQENEIRGAHNVGGIAGYFSGKGTLEKGVNDGGDILATGARNDSGFVKEWVRGGSTGGEETIIGNMGGIVGYMDGDDVYIMASANRGTVHSQDITEDTVLPVSQAANVGGIVGKIDRDETKNIDAIKGDVTQAAVSNSYSTGDVRGYMGVGGIAGMMYNGEIAGSYNLGTVNTTRNAASFGTGSYYSVNMGGIVGDTTEGTNASALLYDVYNKGQIGDETFTYYARHVGGIVGRLSGTVEKAYNTGAIYNGYNVVGGIVGWMYKGSVTNAFNTGNITVYNQEENNRAGIQAGGIAGGAQTGVTISNVYNLGTIRGFQDEPTLSESGNYAVGGIVGAFIYGGSQTISNAYTTGNLYLNVDGKSITSGLGGIYGFSEDYRPAMTLTNTYYIRPDKNLENVFKDLSDSAINQDNSNQAINFDDKDDISQYKTKTGDSLFSGITEQNKVNEADAWRIYDGSTPILNAFLPNAKDYFDKPDTDKSGIDSIQYGTAYDPLLTIIKANGNKANLDFNWQDLKINNDAGLAVYGAGLTLNDFMSTGGSGYFGGLIYSDGALTLNAHLEGDTHDAANTNVTGDVALGSASQLYGSSVAINADGQVTIYGSVTATGNVQDGTSWSKDEHKYTGKIAPTDGSVSISGGSVDIYGQLTSADGQPVKVPGINGMAAGWSPETDRTSVSDPKDAMSDIGDRFGYTTQPSDTPTQTPGNISITAVANDAEDGHVNVYYGNKGEGLITTGGSLEVTASGDVYMDSDLSIGGNLTLNTSNDSEAVLDISNIGKVQAAEDGGKTSVEYLHEEFLHHFSDGTHGITMEAGSAKIAVDMWDETENNGNGGFDLIKYDSDKTLAKELNGLTINGEIGKGKDYTYIWVSTGEQLKGIQEAAKTNSDFLGYNFALKNDIDASGVTDYEAIGTGSADGYTGTFDGRDNRIIGLDTTKKADGTPQTLTNAGIFDTIGAGGTVEDLRVYSGTFTGTANAGAVAGVNKGNISNVTAFGNVVDVSNQTENGSSYAGGIAGTNSGTIDNASAIGTATQSSTVTAESREAAAGGIAGLNTNNGTISTSTSNSAVNASEGNATALGGVAGVNEGKLDNVDSLGVTTGIYKGEDTKYSDNVGGIAGTNSGTVENAYNESIVSGRDNVGGILGENSGKNVSNVANASNVTGEAGNGAASNFVGGLVGDNEGSITNGRNNGKITGNNYVGGLVGKNGTKDSTLTNLVNDSAAAITGDNYVGGIAGSNAGTISADEGNDNLINRGTITGVQYVGGVAGINTGTITNTNNDVDLHVKDGATDAIYFGGVAGSNESGGTITDATNQANVSAGGASHVGGIVGKNDGTLSGMNGNYGNVSGKDYVGGVAGENTQRLEDVTAVNQGSVIASDGGAGGIFAVNGADASIVNSHLTSSGTVTGTTGDGKSGTGGIFGVNYGAISGSTLENKGYTDENGFHDSLVTGTSNTGGLIGINTGSVSTSSLKNEASITVTAGEGQTVENIGGLIGQNSGAITGGRTEEDGTDVGYYKYQIYNNGTITVTGNGTNIGGLFGTNEKNAVVTAGYNTGVIHASGSENVGGIAGTNAGTLNQVFNTVITVNKDGSTVSGSITGSTNVGGIAGTNSGTISNAYNTSDVYGDADSTGSIAGKNDSIISNVYATEKGQPVAEKDLVGNGNEAAHVYNSKDGFSEDGSKIDKDGQGTVADYPWRQYGDNNPILKVFLTQLTVNDVGDLVYNGYDQNLNLNELIGKGKNHITGPTGMENPFEAYYNTLKPNSSYGDSELLYNVGEQVNAGTYQNWLASEQISAGTSGTVNNLGYDIMYEDDTVGEVGKAQISITLDDINRTYGNSTITSSQAHDIGSDAVHVSNGTNDYGYSYTITNQTLTDKMKEQLSGITFDKDSIKDGAVEEVTGDRQTNDAGSYTWKADFSLGTTTPSGTSLADNYEFVSNGQGTSSITVSDGNSTVGKATVTVTLDAVQHTYGDTQTSTDYHIKDNIVWANGDTYTNADVSLGNISDSAFDGETGHTNNAGGKYSWDADISGTGSHADKISQNYNFEVIQGSSVVEKKGITISLGEVSHEYGTPATDGYTFKAEGWVYGQNDFTDDISIGSLGQGITDGALKDNNTHTQDVNQNGYTWTTNNAQIGGHGATNYYIETVKDGTSKVTPVTVDISLGHVTHEYGTLNDQYGLNGNVAWANGDQYTNADVSLGNIKDEADLGNGKTNDVGDNYTWTADVTAGGSDAERIGKNYIFNVVNKGTSEVTPKQIVIVADDKEMYVGGTRPAFTGTNRTEISSQLANGDTLDSLGIKDYDYGPESAVDTTLGNSKYPIVFWYDNHSHSMTTEGLQDLFGGNYNVTFRPGTLTVLALPDGMPEISDIPSIERHWNFLFDDNPWDRNRDFRERKAEVHFVAGGMTL